MTSRIDIIGQNGNDGEHYDMWVDTELLSKQQKRKIEYILKDVKMSRIKVKVLNEGCMPERTHRWDAGWDLKAATAVTIPAGKTAKVHTGVIFEIPPRNCGMVVPRSSLGTKFRVTLANDVGIIDSEYRGEVMVFLSNDSDKDYEVNAGDRFAQILIVPINSAELWPVDYVSDTGRGDGGFGSTGLDGPSKVMEQKKAEAKANSEVGTNPCGEIVLGEAKECVLPTPEDDLTETEKRADTEAERSRKLNELAQVKPSEYVKMKNDGTLFEKYPIATGDMKEDLGL